MRRPLCFNNKNIRVKEYIRVKQFLNGAVLYEH